MEQTEKTTTQLEIERLQVREQLDLLYEAKRKAEDDLEQFNNLEKEVKELKDKKAVIQKSLEKLEEDFNNEKSVVEKESKLAKEWLSEVSTQLAVKQNEVEALEGSIQSMRSEGEILKNQLGLVNQNISNLTIQEETLKLSILELQTVEKVLLKTEQTLRETQGEELKLVRNIEALKQELVNVGLKREESESELILLDKKIQTTESKLEELRLANQTQEAENIKLKEQYLEWEGGRKGELVKEEERIQEREADLSLKEKWFAKQVELVKKYKSDAEKKYGIRFKNLTL